MGAKSMRRRKGRSTPSETTWTWRSTASQARLLSNAARRESRPVSAVTTSHLIPTCPSCSESSWQEETVGSEHMVDRLSLSHKPRTRDVQVPHTVFRSICLTLNSPFVISTRSSSKTGTVRQSGMVTNPRATASGRVISQRGAPYSSRRAAVPCGVPRYGVAVKATVGGSPAHSLTSLAVALES